MRKFAVSCAAMMIAMPALAACGGSSDKPASDSVTIPTDIGNNNGSSNGGDGSFSKLFGEASKQKFKITFTSGSGSDVTTYAQDGNGKSSYTSGDSQTFTSSDGTVTCQKSSGADAECTKIASAGAITNPFFGFYTAGKTYIDALGDKFGSKSTKTIADRKSTCISFSAKDFGGVAAAAIAAAIKGSVSYCVDSDTGVLMEISRTDENGTKSSDFEVTKFEEPSDSDFTPPATPKDATTFSIPTDISLPPGITIPGQ